MWVLPAYLRLIQFISKKALQNVQSSMWNWKSESMPNIVEHKSDIRKIEHWAPFWYVGAFESQQTKKK